MQNIEPLTRAPMSSPPNKWIVNPWLDLLLCCGGLTWILFAAVLVGNSAGQENTMSILVLISSIGTYLFSEPHNMATLVRVARSREHRRRFLVRWLPVPLTVFVLAVSSASALGVLVKIYLLWLVQHYIGQTYGLVLLYCYKNGYQLTPAHKLCIDWLLQCTVLYAVVRHFTMPEWGGGHFLGGPVPFIGPLPEQFLSVVQLLLFALCACFAAMVLTRLVKRRRLFPLPGLLLLCTGVAVFLVSRPLAGVLWLFVPAFFHASQYVVLTMSMEYKNKLSEGASKLSFVHAMRALVPYVLSLSGLSLVLFLGIPALVSLAGVDFSLAALAMFLAINFHHFAVDQQIWKLRDQGLRKQLTG